MKKLFFLITALLIGNASASCRSVIKNALCLVDPLDESNPFANQYSRPCLEGGEKYRKYFYEHYDRSSALIKKMYCSLDKIWIENELNTTAYAVPVKDQSDRIVAGAIGISRKFLDAQYSLKEWLEQKENSSFGHQTKIRYVTNFRKKISAVDYAINHEFGHLFDYANDLQRSWSEINNTSFGPFQSKLCFYQCGGEYIPENQANELYEGFMHSSYVSTYATMSSKEDWAETFALYLAQEENGLELKMKIQDAVFDLHQHLNSEFLKEKKDFYRSFLQAPIKYPADN